MNKNIVQNKIGKVSINTNADGFTLIEALVAISIFTVSILALVAVLSNSVANINYAKKKVIATYLAQEGIEYIRNIRDTYVLYPVVMSDGTGSDTWNDFRVEVSSCDVLIAKGCYFDDKDLDYLSTEQPITKILVAECPSGVCPSLLYDEASGKYNYTTGETTDFIRKINVEQIKDDELKITSTVSWTQGSGTYEVSFSENLFNWVK